MNNPADTADPPDVDTGTNAPPPPAGAGGNPSDTANDGIEILVDEAATTAEKVFPGRSRLPEQPAADAPDEAEGPDGGRETILEMRQVAGLTSGSVMDLHPGSFQFRESDSDVGFSLVVRSVDDVLVVPGTADAVVDEIRVDEPTPLGEAVLNVGTACFTVRPPRPAPTPAGRLAILEEAGRSPKAITVPQGLEPAGLSPSQTRSNRFGSLFPRADDGSEAALDPRSWAFLESIRDVRSSVAERHRALHPDPEELRSRLNRLDPGLWDRTLEHSLFARFAVAYATIPWEPRFDAPERIPLPLHNPIREMSCLPWVPVTANLLFGPLGIVGSRPAVLAAARAAVLSLACLSAPTDIEFSIVTAQGLVEDWSWTSALPNSLFPTGGNAYCIAVADGMAHFDGAGFDHEAVQRNEMGLVVLAESLDELPEYCGTILQITAEGRCQVSNHLGEQIVGTPIGVTAGFAAATAAAITAAVGDDVPEEPPPAAGNLPPARPAPEVEAERGPFLADDFVNEFSELFGPELPDS